MSARARFLTLALGMMALVVLALFWGALVRGETFALRDLRAYYHPAKAILAPLARASGGLPLWNPLFASGQPFAENPEHELFHPLTWLVFVLPFEVAFRCQVILPILCATGTMFLFLRSLPRSRPAALFGAVTWGLGGYLLSTTTLLPILFAVSVLPLVLLAATRVARNPAPTEIAGLAVTFALICLAGEPSTLLATPLLVAAAVASSRRRVRVRVVARVAAGLLLGAALGGVVLVPGLHHAASTVRAQGLPDPVASAWSLAPPRLLELLTPHVLGHAVGGPDQVYFGAAFYPDKQHPFLYSLYPGLLATVLAAAAWTARGRGRWPWLAVGALGALLAVGRFGPVWPLARHLPGLSGLRYPEKFALLFVLPVAVGAAGGFDLIARGPARSRRAALGALAIVAAVAGVATIALLVLGRTRETAAVARDAGRLLAVAASALALLWSWPRLRGSARALAPCALLAADLALAGAPIVATVPVSSVADPPPALLPAIRGGRDELLFHQAEWQLSAEGSTMLAGQPPMPAQWGLALTLEQDLDLTQLAWTVRSTELFWRAVNRNPKLAGPLLQRRGVTSILSLREGAPRRLSLLGSPDAQPFAFAARRVQPISADDAWVDAVVALDAGARDAVCVSRADLPEFPQAPAPARVAVASRAPGAAALDVDAAGPGPSFIAINQTWHPGWLAQVDGQPARLYRVDVALSGLVLPPGRHRVELEYRSRALDAGMTISAAAALACGALVMVGRRRRG
jgi:hypothetical protein